MSQDNNLSTDGSDGTLPAETANKQQRSRNRKRRRVDNLRENRVAAKRPVNYRQLRNPFPQMAVFSEDRVHAMHEASLDLLENLGLKVLLPEARALYKSGGARVNESTEMVFIGREMVEAALVSAPKSIHCRAAKPEYDVVLEPGAVVFQPAAGAPHATDLERGRRPGCARDFNELLTLTQHFDVLQMIPPLVEPQDVAINLRHYFTMRSQLTLTEKLPFIFSRGTPQVEESFEMLCRFRGLSEEEFQSHVHTHTIINTNSPRQLDIPMAQGLIDFARFNQVSIVTPFTLMGAMAPITVAGAMTLSHAEALAGITLTQLARPGAPVCYGTFTSNVDMKSGSPAFGTPEHMKASLVAGQLARLTGLPWRCASGSAANIADAQAANENQFGLWGCMLAGATITVHAAGWLEGGLSVSYEKLITDIEVLQMIAEMCHNTSADDAEIGMDALAEIQPGGHFFSTEHTMQRYQTEFYQPLAADWSNHGTWSERGAKDASQRATGIWQNILQQAPSLEIDGRKLEELDRFIEKQENNGGAAPVS